VGGTVVETDISKVCALWGPPWVTTQDLNLVRSFLSTPDYIIVTWFGNEQTFFLHLSPGFSSLDVSLAVVS